jgi:hypothetical protein
MVTAAIPPADRQEAAISRAPPCKDRTIQLSLPPIENMTQISSAVSTVLEAVAVGDITPSEGETVANILAVQTEVVTTADVDRRLQEVETILSAQKSDKSDPAAAEITQRLREGRTLQVVDRVQT